MAAQNFRLPKLNEKNYLAWELKLRMYLIQQGLWSIIQDPPSPLSEAEDIHDIQSALAAIILCLEDRQLPLVRGVESAQIFWQNLRRAHVRDTCL